MCSRGPKQRVCIGAKEGRKAIVQLAKTRCRVLGSGRGRRCRELTVGHLLQRG